MGDIAAACLPGAVTVLSIPCFSLTSVHARKEVTRHIKRAYSCTNTQSKAQLRPFQQAMARARDRAAVAQGSGSGSGLGSTAAAAAASGASSKALSAQAHAGTNGKGRKQGGGASSLAMLVNK